MMRTTGKRKSERWDLTPLTFLTVFCKAGDGRRDKQKKEEEVSADMRAACKRNITWLHICTLENSRLVNDWTTEL